MKFNVSLPSVSPVLVLAFVGSTVPGSDTASTFTVLDASLSSVNVVADVEATFEVSLTKVTLSLPLDVTAALTDPFAKNSPITALASPTPLNFLYEYFLCISLSPIVFPFLKYVY